jgi:hypothetical protein
MTYYRVKPEHDNKTRFKFHKGGGLEIDGIYIKNELYTAKELSKYLGAAAYCEQLEIPKSKVYFFFGARFAEV